ncbi:MAG: NUDIX domain-containing protein [Alphaproteobacteria bacterium]|nr:NUDIX domain-containing protein [Alphaproteobacteria bacterium]MCL2758563.1 NUDIX domain-containing protein [Alphaproteobacteria bacterium]
MQYKNTTIVCIFDGDKILMMRKSAGMKNFSAAVDGHGKGLYNFPGGKCKINLETGAVQSFHDCAIEETREETGIIPVAPFLIGQLQFVWPDIVLVNQVFITDKHTGVLKPKTEESKENLWVPVDKIPYDKMWPSDKIWVPHVLARRPFHMEVSGPADGPVCKSLPLDFSIRAR